MQSSLISIQTGIIFVELNNVAGNISRRDFESYFFLASCFVSFFYTNMPEILMLIVFKSSLA